MTQDRTIAASTDDDRSLELMVRAVCLQAALLQHADGAAVCRYALRLTGILRRSDEVGVVGVLQTGVSEVEM